jgi:hypothetical protein
LLAEVEATKVSGRAARQLGMQCVQYVRLSLSRHNTAAPTRGQEHKAWLLILIVLLAGLCLQPWYSALEAMRYLLPDDQAREKLTGQSWQVCAASADFNSNARLWLNARHA